MKHHFLFLFLCSLTIFSPLNSQEATATVHLVLLDESNGKPLENTIEWHCPKTKKDFYFKTDKNGKVSAIIPINETYKLSIPQSLAIYTVVVPNTPNYVSDLVLKFEIEKEETVKKDTIVKPTIQKAKPNIVEIVKQNLVGIQFLNKTSNKRVEVIDLDTKKKIWESSGDSIRLILPTKGHYKLTMEGVKIENDTFSMSSFSPKMLPFVLHFNSDNTAKLYPTFEKTVMNLIQTNLNGIPVVGDSIAIIGKKRGLKYQAMTGRNGSVLFVIPKDDSYQIDLKYSSNIATINVESSKNIDLSTFSYTIIYPSSKENDERKREQEISIAVRDSLYKIFKSEMSSADTSLLFKRLKKEWESSFAQYEPNKPLNIDSIKQKLKQDPHYFEKISNAVCAIFFRFHKKWADKVIVTDVTGSMYPYMRELALWHSLEFMKDEKNVHVFFNDGDNKSDYAKAIGKTGGIYTTQSIVVDSVVNTMNKAMSNGSGGDAAENNIEALIEAEKFVQTSFKEIILIADSYSPIKDLSLLSKLNRPVRVILCGANVFTGFHPDYLWLAYKTGGSIHTIEDDIMNLSTLVQGKIFTIKGRSYKLLNDRFFEIR
jgi:hypothetical protein